MDTDDKILMKAVAVFTCEKQPLVNLSILFAHSSPFFRFRLKYLEAFTDQRGSVELCNNDDTAICD